MGQESVFPLKNGAPRIMTKYKDKPYTYELQPEYAAGERKFPCVKAMDWTGKTATAQVIRGFIQGTPVVEKCGIPLCISRLVIAPKFAPKFAHTECYGLDELLYLLFVICLVVL